MAMRIDMQDVESSQIHSIGHDPATKTLAIRFTSRKGGAVGPGSLYHYENFDANEFEAFKSAESLGAHFGQRIKAYPEKYPFQKINEAAQAA